MQFVTEAGYKTQDVDTLNQAIDQMLVSANPDTVFLPSGRISPFVKAVLALKGVDGAAKHARYRLRYGQDMIIPADTKPVTVSYVQIDRFNLGPAIRDDLVQSHGAQNVAPSSAFGTQPHVSWRLAMTPIMGHKAIIVAASRAEISTERARTETCFDMSCLSTAPVIDNLVPWSQMQSTDFDSDQPYQVMHNGLVTPAAAIDVLTADLSFEPREGVQGSEPYVETVVELNLGQDAMLDAALREGALMDDSVSAIWHRIAALPVDPGVTMPQIYAARAFECNRGPDFADPGSYCL